ncbi:acyltransferase [Halomonas sp.]|uniref:acyltransferase n=1 Tax=Halomonas sp. TaxID=1486246 RepID=UPI0025BB0883|nr:acyltransferase [Halomonas sp.]
MRRIVQAFLAKIYRVLKALWRSLERADVPKFNSCGVGFSFDLPLKVLNPQCISVGDHVKLGPSCQLAAIKEYPGPWLRSAGLDIDLQRFDPVIYIGNRVTATNGLHIFAQSSVVIGDGVSFGPNVYINDASHGRKSIKIPFVSQPLQDVEGVSIGNGCWISANVVILPGVNIGEQSIIGANSVVSENCPPFCIAVGVPARVVKQWNFETQSWEKVE